MTDELLDELYDEDEYGCDHEYTHISLEGVLGNHADCYICEKCGQLETNEYDE